MSSEIENTTGVFARMVAWWHGLSETVPPDLARCEFECRESKCAAERFDACDNRLEYASKIRAGEAKATPCVADRGSTVNH